VDGSPAAPIPDLKFFAYGVQGFGCVVSSGDADGDGFDEIITAPGPSWHYGSHVRGWNYDNDAITPLPGLNFSPWPFPQARYGARIFAGCDLDGLGGDEIVVGAGPDPDITSQVKVFHYEAGAVFQVFTLEAFPSDWTYGVNVAAGRFSETY
jgi:hypothetical protein